MCTYSYVCSRYFITQCNICMNVMNHVQCNVCMYFITQCNICMYENVMNECAMQRMHVFYHTCNICMYECNESCAM